jgi:hypothetical protein
MENSGFDARFRRREMVRLAATASLAFWAESYALAASDFWDKKKPSEWTDQEKSELRTKSPWAKKVDAEMGGGGGGSRGGGGGGQSVAPAANFGGAQAPSLEVVWLSAKPLQDAHPLALGAKLENHYVISVTGIPPQIINAVMMGRGGGRGSRGGGRDGAQSPPPSGPPSPPDAATPPAAPPDPTAGLKRGSTLTAKGKDPQNADVVMSMGNNTTILFGFAKEALPLTVADKEAEFDLKLGGLTAKVKFALKEMMYQGELAL